LQLRGRIVKFAAFLGRGSRLEFTVAFAITLGLGLIALLLHYGLGGRPWTPWLDLALAVPNWWISLAALARRMHDMDKSAWLLLLMIVPIVGIVFLVWCFARPGTPGANRYGAAPNAP